MRMNLAAIVPLVMSLFAAGTLASGWLIELPDADLTKANSPNATTRATSRRSKRRRR